MTSYTEKNTTQQGVIDLLVAAGWRYVPGKHLPRTASDVLIDAEVRDVLARLNPHLLEHDGGVESAVITLRRGVLAAADEGLLAANQLMTRLLRGLGTTLIPDTGKDEPFQVIDFVHPDNNSFVVSDEVVYQDARFDIVLWVNGIPVVVGEAKTPVKKNVSWVNGAQDIVQGYEVQQPAFFAPNLLNFSTDGNELRYAGIRTPLDLWNLWGDSAYDANLAGWPRVELTAATLLAPGTVLNLIANYAMFETDNVNGKVQTVKLLPRYFQYETVEAIVQRVTAGERKRGLVYHTQGSGKTLAMSWVAMRLVLDPRMENPTIVAVADRTQLVKQTFAQFASVNVHEPIIAGSSRGLQQALAQDERGIIATTVHKFKNAGLLSERENIIVLVDEAHRTQEGRLGLDMREALPNASWFGFTGTPIADTQRNTFKLFGDENDPDWALSTYDSDRSIADGITVPIVVVPRPVKFHMDKDALDKGLEASLDEAELTAEEREVFASRISKRSIFLHNPERIRAVVEDIVTHYTEHIAPNGMKAQIVVGDRELCVKYQDVLAQVLSERALPYTSAVVISGNGGKDDLENYVLNPAAEEAVIADFKKVGHPLSFLIVTAKLGTGFNAPIEGVMYLDKPLKLHTLFQTITRTNRTWTNPETGFSKPYGTIVDYIGLGDGFVRAMSPADPERKQQEIDIAGLLPEFEMTMKLMLTRFVGVPREDTMDSLQQALSRIPMDTEYRADFQAEFLRAQGLWETIAPAPELNEFETDYRWLAQVYGSIPSGNDRAELLWKQYGAKTRALVHAHMVNVRVTDSGVTVNIADAETIQRLIAEGKLVKPPRELRNKSAQEIVDSLSARIKRRLEGDSGEHPVYRSIAERLEKLAQQEIQRAEDSVEWLTTVFELGAELKTVEEADDAGLLENLPDSRIGVLEWIFEENTPHGQTVLVRQVVIEVDKLVRDIATFPEWASKEESKKDLKKALWKLFRRHKLPLSGEPFDSAWKYILTHY